MAKTVANLRDSISGQLSGLNLNNVTNLNTALERAARELRTLISMPETQGKLAVTLYDGVTDYTAPTDGYNNTILDFRPQGISRSILDYTYRDSIQNFDRTKAWITNGYHLTFEYVNGVKILRVASNVPVPKIELDAFDQTTGWTAAGSASGLTEDDTVFYQTPSALRFTLTGASTGTLTKSISSQDLTDYVGVGVVFLAIRTPSATNLTSIAVKLGSDASNYYSVSTTTGFLGAWVASEWLLVALDLSGATTTGTPTVTAIDYAQITITHGATLTNFYIGAFWISLPSPHDLIYGTDAIFLPSGSTTPSSSITSTSDTVVLNDETYVIYEKHASIVIAQQQGGSLAEGLVGTLQAQENQLISLYRARNPAQDVMETNSYYDI